MVKNKHVLGRERWLVENAGGVLSLLIGRKCRGFWAFWLVENAGGFEPSDWSEMQGVLSLLIGRIVSCLSPCCFIIYLVISLSF